MGCEGKLSNFDEESFTLSPAIVHDCLRITVEGHT